MAGVNCYKRDNMAHKVYNITYLVLYQKKKCPTLDLDSPKAHQQILWPLTEDLDPSKCLGFCYIQRGTALCGRAEHTRSSRELGGHSPLMEHSVQDRKVGVREWFPLSGILAEAKQQRQ